MLQKILIPLDGSPLGEQTLAYAGELAIALGSELQMVCATLRQDEETTNMCNIYLGKMAEDVADRVHKARPEVSVKTVVVGGEAADALLKYAVEKKIGLIMLSAHGHSGLMPWALGATASKIVHRSPVPVFLVRGKANKKPAAGLFKKILVPLDGSPLGESALPYVLSIAAAVKSEVILFWVLEAAQRVHTIGGQDTIIFNSEVIDRMKTEGIAYMEKVKQKIGNRVNVRCVCKEGDAAHEILKMAETEAVNLVAMSSHGKSGITRWMLGSVSNKIVQAGKTPILLVRPPEST